MKYFSIKDLEKLPDPVKFLYISMTQSAIYFMKTGRNKDFYLSFCNEIWKSIELSELKNVEDYLESYMKKQIEARLESYIRGKRKKV